MLKIKSQITGPRGPIGIDNPKSDDLGLSPEFTDPANLEDADIKNPPDDEHHEVEYEINVLEGELYVLKQRQKKIEEELEHLKEYLQEISGNIPTHRERGHDPYGLMDY